MSKKYQEQLKEIEQQAMEDLNLIRNEQGFIMHNDSEQQEVKE